MNMPISSQLAIWLSEEIVYWEQYKISFVVGNY